MEIVVTEDLKRLVNVTCKDETRPTLQHIHIKEGKATATNGFCLMQTCMDVNNGNTHPVLIPASIVKDVKVTKRGVTPVLIVRDDEIEIIDSKARRVHKTHEVGSYPDIDRVLNNDTPEYRCGFTVNILMEMLKCYDKDDVIELAFTNTKEEALGVRGCTHPVRVSNRSKNVTGVIMPALIE